MGLRKGPSPLEGLHNPPEIEEGKNVFIQNIDNFSDKEIEIPMGVPLMYEIDLNIKHIGYYYLRSE